MQNEKIRIAVLDDWQGVAKQSADWSALQQRADIAFFEDPFAGQDDLVKAVATNATDCERLKRKAQRGKSQDRVPGKRKGVIFST